MKNWFFKAVKVIKKLQKIQIHKWVWFDFKQKFKINQTNLKLNIFSCYLAIECAGKLKMTMMDENTAT